MNYILQYHNKITNGDIIVSKKVAAVYDYLYYKVNNPNQYIFDESKANRVIEFIQTFCKHGEGKSAGRLRHRDDRCDASVFCVRFIRIRR